MSVEDDMGYDCDVTVCPNPASWAYIGEAGDMYLCDEHHHDAPNWHRILP